MRGLVYRLMVPVCVCLMAAGCVTVHSNSNAGMKWRQIGPCGFGAVRMPAISPHDPQTIIAGVDMGSAFITRDGGKSWKTIGRAKGASCPMAYRGYVNAYFDPVDKNVVFLSSGSGLFRSEDGGETWDGVIVPGPSEPLCPITSDPSNHNIIYAATGINALLRWGNCSGKIYRSADNGRTWTSTQPAGERADWISIAVDPESYDPAAKCCRRIYVCGPSGFLVSDDAGGTWKSLEDKLPGGKVNLVASDKGLYMSGIISLALVPGAGRQSKILATIRIRKDESGNCFGGVYASSDGGLTWQEKNTGLSKYIDWVFKWKVSMPQMIITACRAKPSVVYCLAGDGVYKSTDGGESWQFMLAPGDHDALKGKDYDGKDFTWLVFKKEMKVKNRIYPSWTGADGIACSETNPDVVAASDICMLILSYDGGKTWNMPLVEYGDKIRAIGECLPGVSNSVMDRAPMPLTHRQRSKGPQIIVPYAVAVDPFDAKTIAVGYDDIGLYITRDNGTWWEWAYEGIPAKGRFDLFAVVYDPEVKGRMWVAAHDDVFVYRSDDGGRKFSMRSAPPAEKAFIYNLCIDPSSPRDRRNLYAATAEGVFRSDDCGVTWRKSSAGISDDMLVRLVVGDPKNPGVMYAAALNKTPDGLGQAGLYRSGDKGVHWERIGADKIGGVASISVCGKTGVIVVTAVKAGDRWGVFTPRKVWRSDDHGNSWTDITAPNNISFISCAAVNPVDDNIILYMTYARDVNTEAVNVYRSGDGGKTWRIVGNDVVTGAVLSLMSVGGQVALRSIVFDPVNPNRYFLITDCGVWEGTDKK